jgi:lipopolysaccharide transport system ATP-binding protein
MLLDGHRPEFLEGSGCIRCTFRNVPLLPQNYTLKMSLRAANGIDPIIPYQEVASFTVAGDLAEYGYTGQYLNLARTSTPVVVPYEWQLPDGRIAAVSLNRPDQKQIERELPGITVQK